jgi:hypothetical protein
VRVYISGPIKGRPDGNREAFRRAEIRLAELGCDSVNPHHINPDHTGRECVGELLDEERHRYGCYLRADIRELVACDAYVVLDGWNGSKGAQAEVVVAQAIGLPRVGIDPY